MIGIYYFSGTGNTAKCVAELAKKLEDGGEKCKYFRVESGDERIEESADTVIFGYPIHGFNTPENIISFAKSFPQGAKRAYIIKTSGEPLCLNDNSSAGLISILEEKGIQFMGECHLVMPYNMIFRHTDAMAAKMFAVAKEKIAVFAGEILCNRAVTKSSTVGEKVAAKVASKVCGIEHFGMRLNGIFYRVKKDQCKYCMACVNNCPRKNITFEGGKFHFGTNCIGCMRCSFNCPNDAFRIGLLNFMRVNGRYNFNADPGGAKIGSYCRSAYEKYFGEQ